MDRLLARLRRLLALPLLLLVRAYQVVFRPILPPLCRFHPSCSDYALEALRVHGPLRGSLLAARRLSRCHPWNPGGVDLVPPAHVHGEVSARRCPSCSTTPAE